MSPDAYLKHTLSSDGNSLPWLLPLLYVLLAMTLVAWAGMRYSNRSRRGRALFVFTIGIVLLALSSASFFLQAVRATELVGVGVAATLLGCAMLVVATGSLLPSVEDWFGARRELRIIQPLLTELGRRHPDVGIGVRPRGPLVFRVAERMSLISDALFLEATAADTARKRRVDATGSLPSRDVDEDDGPELDSRRCRREEQARAIAEWIYAGREGAPKDDARGVPGTWLAAPANVVFGPRMDPRNRAGSTASWTQRWCDGLSDAQPPKLRRTPHCGEPRANRPGAPGDAARRPSGRCPAAPRRTSRRCAPQYGERPRRAYSRARSIPCPASRSTRRR